MGETVGGFSGVEAERGRKEGGDASASIAVVGERGMVSYRQVERGCGGLTFQRSEGACSGL
ncbi:hypothetical protein E2562_038630 [Oryza meyeriana var. granulata]|uniref:Uncharacterized protein n=1 Tax=Oryza meyeriana var. granulata TaxID=110450 RepID=A0A6G1CXR2_9ORYZ|nr:hypothetical protein E2562_038630 [Oryza meyeriana var. granulata]